MDHPATALKAWRAEQGLSQTVVATAVGGGQSAVAEWESGNRRPEPAYAVRIEALSGSAVSIEAWGHDPAVLTARVALAANGLPGVFALRVRAVLAGEVAR